MSGIFYPTLITTTNNVIKQNALEVLEKFVATGKEEVVREILIISNEVQSYFKKELPTRNFDEEYFRTIGALKYEHQCVKWQDNAGHVSKRIKLDEVPRKIKEKPTRFEKQHKDTLKKPRRVQNVEVTEQTVGDIEDEKPEVVNEAIASIKGEVKSLMNVLKTEKLTQKNISDLKMISNQLLSLM
ncbi:hypothetical protein JTB14_014077 [Gonioctena quinquepunctata]|nr:hypothetical protein JTB14_014077 [Gonioctena quinquepunctata]